MVYPLINNIFHVHVDEKKKKTPEVKKKKKKLSRFR